MLREKLVGLKISIAISMVMAGLQFNQVLNSAPQQT